MTLLELKKVTAGYGELTVLNDLSITVGAGELVALIGPNGAGKSTVLKTIFSLTKQEKGTILFKGADITHFKTHELLEIGISYVPQGRINFSKLTVEENLRIGGLLLKEEEVIKERLETVYNLFPILKKKQKELAYSLSGGQHQILALGRALMQDPSLLLLDEPSLGLAPKLITQLFEIITSLRNEGIAILLVEQNAKKAIQTADRTYLLEQGKVALEGGKEIMKHPKIRSVYLGGDVDE